MFLVLILLKEKNDIQSVLHDLFNKDKNILDEINICIILKYINNSTCTKHEKYHCLKDLCC